MLSNTGHNLSHAATFCPNICRLKTSFEKDRVARQTFCTSCVTVDVEVLPANIGHSLKTSKLEVIFPFHVSKNNKMDV